jgi:hypothetical protein
MQLDFDVTTERLSFKNARACVAGCADSYQREPDIFDNVTDIQVRIIRGMCALRNPWVAFFFRGTFNLQGWLRDFDPATVRFGNGSAHKATTDSVEAVFTKIRMAVESKRDYIFVGGHSKGAREAQNCAFRLHELNFNVKQVYTFGTPRGFDFFAARDYNARLGKKTFRFTNGSDIVARVPFPPHWFHAGQELYMPSGDILGTFHSADWKLNPSLAYKLACDGAELYREWRRYAPAFADHKIDKYVQAVSALQS